VGTNGSQIEARMPAGQSVKGSGEVKFSNLDALGRE
jgi:hypothetical protein